MATINLRRFHNRTLAEATHAVELAAQRVSQQFSLKSTWSTPHRLEFSRTGVSGSITIQENEIEVNAELGFLLGALKTPIEQEIIRQLEEQLLS